MLDSWLESQHRNNWQSGPSNVKKGEEWLKVIYGRNLPAIDEKLSFHKDFHFLSREITYGLYLSDMTILDPIDTEMVVLSGIMIQNLPLATRWHLRGMRRLGVVAEDVEMVQKCVSLLCSRPESSQRLT